ncbi:TolC family protein [Thalassomonas viridans]|uniref:TolC family protein n=1 Tax=Thalassomonas viridans TaxID=137584 RepID=A0AAF0CDC7_9GAMM|nr:TolC family protein [Thalassomonas viridans]WDE07994.1 TolC family protein [Thalassomonas viridans]
MFYSFYAPFQGADLRRPVITCLVAIGLLLLSPRSIAENQAQDMALAQANGSSLTLASAIRRTLKENPSLKLFKYRRLALDGQQQVQGLTPGYELGVEVENFAGTGDFNAVGAAELNVSLSSVLEMGDKRAARLGVVNSRGLVVDAERKLASLNLLAEVTRRYIDVLGAQERVRLAEEAGQLAQQALLEVEKRFHAGAAPGAEVKRARAAVGTARLGASAEQQQLEHAKLALAMMWKETEPSFARVDGDLFNFSVDIEFNRLLAKVKQNPAFTVLAGEERLKQAELRLARTRAKADIKWSVGLKQNLELDDTAITAGFSLPLFAPERNYGAEASAQAARDQVLARQEAAVLKLHSQLYLAYSNRQQAIFTANSLKDTIIPMLKQALDETQTAYQSGRYPYLDYLTARQELLFARRALIDAGVAALSYGADIEQLIAEPLSASRDPALMNTFQGLTQ